MDMSAIRTAILRQLESDLAMQLNAALTSRDEAIDEESKAENKYDTHAQEAAYLAEGQARIVADLRESISQFAALPHVTDRAPDRITLGSLATLQDPKGTTTHLFLGPRSGGLEVEHRGNRIMVVTPASPLGHQLLGGRVGDTIVSAENRSKIVQRIVAVC
ncbi:MAG: transcription elongation factor [Opitutaceae bacterium]|jgi:transcription elongation GreA/GreB family factor|nr:transcription elongation factor [Opitutaceae bacterium]